METFKFEQLENTSKKNEKGQVPATKEEVEQAEQWLISHTEKETTARECSKEIVEFQDMVARFESMYPIEELNAIVDLTADPEHKHPLRDSAKEALKPIFAKLNILKNETNMSTEKHEELKMKWKRLSNAVGMVNKGIVDHNR